MTAVPVVNFFPVDGEDLELRREVDLVPAPAAEVPPGVRVPGFTVKVSPIVLDTTGAPLAGPRTEYLLTLLLFLLGPPLDFAFRTAWAAASRAMGSRYGEQDT